MKKHNCVCNKLKCRYLNQIAHSQHWYSLHSGALLGGTCIDIIISNLIQFSGEQRLCGFHWCSFFPLPQHQPVF